MKVYFATAVLLIALGLRHTMAAADACSSTPLTQGDAMTVTASSPRVEILDAPGEVALQRIRQGVFIWERAPAEPTYSYAGSMPLHGVVAVFVPAGRQLETWANFEKRIGFCVHNRRSGRVYRSNYVVGGWNLARQGISVQMAEPQMIPEVFAHLPDNQMDERHFSIDLMERLIDMPEPGDTLEVTAEFMGSTSNTVTIKVAKIAIDTDQ